MNKFLLQILTPFLIMLLSSQLSYADSDYNQAKKLLDAGEILSLEQIINRLSVEYPGHVLDVELETENQQVIYQIELVDKKGLLWELTVDARTGQLMEKKQDD